MSAQNYALKAGDIFVLPDAVTQIKKLIDDSSASMQDIADVINFDPALTMQILKIANSALYKFPNQIESISKAVQVIGTKSIYDLVVAYGVAKAFDGIDTEVINLDKFWEQSVCCALLAKFFGDKLGQKSTERLFVAGLLHNVGELVMVKLEPDIARACTEFSEEITPAQLQKKALGFSYADISSALIKIWGIPETIYEPIGKLHNMGVDEDSLDDKVMQLAYVLAIENVNQEFYLNNTQLEPCMYECFGFEIDDLENALDHTNLQIMNVLALFSPSSFAIY
ncbi:HDOD domain-containing protein [Alteromonadaceae bacterium M269]|nr:HDOD domain-containing protein [Alteromonadaceae bacterium M269]